jgi:hypothetical protein
MRAAECAPLGRGNRLRRWRVSGGDAQGGGCSSHLERQGNHATFDATAANPIRAQRLRAVTSTPISEELADRVRRAH